MARTGLAQLTGRVLRWPPQSAADFAEVAQVMARVLGDSVGVRSVEVHRNPTRVRVVVRAADAEYVRRVAAEQGWQLVGDAGRYAMTWAFRLGLTVTVMWTGESPFEVPAQVG